METKCCGTCKWHKCNAVDRSWSCYNTKSDCWLCKTDYSHCCKEWEGQT